MVKLAKNGAGWKGHLRSMLGQKAVRLLLRLRTGSAGCRIRRDVKYIGGVWVV